MKRRTVNTVFAASAFVCASLSIYQYWTIHRIRSVNQAVTEVPATLSDREFARLQLVPERLPVHLQFAYASALSAGGQLETAEKYFGTMALDPDHPQLALAAQFNLANGYLREALLSDRVSGRFRSMVELAKQRYRDLLQVKPDHWDARYNLELALRLVPEQERYQVDDRGKPIKSVSVVFPGFEDRELP